MVAGELWCFKHSEEFVMSLKFQIFSSQYRVEHFIKLFKSASCWETLCSIHQHCLLDTVSIDNKWIHSQGQSNEFVMFIYTKCLIWIIIIILPGLIFRGYQNILLVLGHTYSGTPLIAVQYNINCISWAFTKSNRWSDKVCDWYAESWYIWAFVSMIIAICPAFMESHWL